MNKEELLSEGYLVGYITGELTDEQAEEVNSFIADDPEVRHELFDLQKVLELLTFRYSLAPRPVVKQLVMEDPAVKSHHSPVAGTASLKLLMAASVMVALVSLFTSFYFWKEWKTTDDRMAELTARNLRLAESYHIVNQELTEIREDLSVLVSPEFSRIILSGTENAPGTKVVVYWNPAEAEIFLNSANLAALPQHQQYQLWALIDGKPVDAGVFDAESGTFQLMKGVAKADAFAVTIEQTGGSSAPTLETMQVFGEIPDLG